MRTLIGFEWRRLHRSGFAWGLPVLAIVLVGLFFWFSQVGVEQYRQQLLNHIQSNDEILSQLIGGYRQTIADDLETADRKAEAKKDMALAVPIGNALDAQQRAVEDRSTPRYLRAVIAANTRTIVFDNALHRVLLQDHHTLTAQTKLYQTMLARGWALEDTRYTTQPVGFLVSWQSWLAQPLAVLLGVALLSTTWVTALFTNNADLMATAVQPWRRWALANWFWAVLNWLAFLTLSNTAGWLAGQWLGTPLLSGSTPWPAIVPGTGQSYWTVWVQEVGTSLLWFIPMYGILLLVTAYAEKWGRRR